MHYFECVITIKLSALPYKFQWSFNEVCCNRNFVYQSHIFKMDFIDFIYLLLSIQFFVCVCIGVLSFNLLRLLHTSYMVGRLERVGFSKDGERIN